jgi:hypothetical protein
MLRIDARPPVAVMAHMQSLRYGTNKEFVSDAMNQTLAILTPMITPITFVV